MKFSSSCSPRVIRFHSAPTHRGSPRLRQEGTPTPWCAARVCFVRADFLHTVLLQGKQLPARNPSSGLLSSSLRYALAWLPGQRLGLPACCWHKSGQCLARGWGSVPCCGSLIDGLEWKRTFLVPEAHPYFLISENMKIMPNGL